jgi:DNA-binding LytR/AlgR family response regulator
MDVLIIEDELPARAKLISMLQALDPSIQVMAQLGSVKETLEWLRQNKAPHLAFVDIQLSDDHSFEIFRRTEVKFPVIFTTAYDKYIMESFEFNSIDYLLKPITEEKLKRSLEKIRTLERHFFKDSIQHLVQQNISTAGRIVARKGAEFIAISHEEIAYFFSDHKITFVRDFSGRQMIVDKTLAELESLLSTKSFFRINRKFLATHKAIEKFKPDNGKIQVFLKPEVKEEVHVSKETAPEFRKWIES